MGLRKEKEEVAEETNEVRRDDPSFDSGTPQDKSFDRHFGLDAVTRLRNAVGSESDEGGRASESCGRAGPPAEVGKIPVERGPCIISDLAAEPYCARGEEANSPSRERYVLRQEGMDESGPELFLKREVASKVKESKRFSLSSRASRAIACSAAPMSPAPFTVVFVGAGEVRSSPRSKSLPKSPRPDVVFLAT